MQGGNLTGVVSYRTSNGQFQRRGTYDGRYGNVSGKDLYVLGDQVNASGLPLYFRPEDNHFIERVAVPTSAGLLAVYTEDPQAENPVALVALADAESDPKKPKLIWKSQLFTENNAVAVARNAVIVAGVHRQGIGSETKTTAGVCALDLKTGTTLWRHDLPAPPVGWGLAIDRDGRVIVTLQDGRVICFR
jgi:outer membrane protein assembly factor BamB